MILKGIKEYNKDNFQIALEKDSAKLLYLLGKIKKVKNALEIGTGIGYSTMHLSLSCEKVISIDKDERNLEIARKLIKKNNLKNIKIIEGDALIEIPKLKDKFDLLFIDGTKREYLMYLKLALPKLNKGAVIIADNTVSHKEKMKDFLDYINKNFYTVELNIGSGMSLSYKE